jgi:hypothetical protein
MTRETGSIAEQVRQHIRTQATRQSSAENAATLVSHALVSTGINVQDITLEEWKALIFDAFQTARQPWDPSCESMLAASA